MNKIAWRHVKRLSAVVLSLASGFFYPSLGRAADFIEYNDRGGYDFTLTAGRFLPYGIVGVRSSYPMWGVLISHPSSVSRVEYGVHFTRSQGVIFYHGSLSARVDFELADSIDGFFSFGADFAYYQRKGSQATPEYPYYMSGGGHFGFGAFYEIGRNWSLRADFKSNFGPGKSLYTGMGLLYRWGQAPTP